MQLDAESNKPSLFLNCLCFIAPLVMVFIAGWHAPLFFAIGFVCAVFLMTRKSTRSNQIGRSILIGLVIAAAFWGFAFHKWNG